MGAGVVGQDVGRVALCAAARARAAAVEPVHVLAVVVPDAEDEDHAAAEGLAHGGEASVGRGGRARRDGVAAGLGAGDVDAVLPVLAGDADEVARGRAVVRVELGDDGEGLGGVDGVSGAEVAGGESVSHASC